MKHLFIMGLCLILSITSIMAHTNENKKVLSDELCDKLCAAAQSKSREIGIDISFAIADADGLPRVYRRFGDALVLSITLVPAKAYTSAVTQTSTEELAKLVVDNAPLQGIQTVDSRITLVAGGFPLFHEGKIIGAIGVGGGTKEQDCEIGKYLLKVFEEETK